MEKERKIRLLRADEIECRVASVSEKGVSLLLYKDARVDQNILDETFGMLGWQRTHEKIGDALFCSVSILSPDGTWITKQDVGTESFAEPTKGAASDAFKRACFNIGIGRELYTAPFIWVPAEKVNIQHNSGKLVVKDQFQVSRIQYEDGKTVISGVEIQNGKKAVVFSYGLNGVRTKEQTEKKEKITPYQERLIRNKMKRTGVSEDTICKRYKVNTLQDMDDVLYERAMEALGKTKGVAA